eukprot:TRINITY_DN25385_c0_g1_i1.p1 TRINITY_DN25385_c0_g1~~TRINITY_DN25385_c0_g1_i1.p1  ORF type:complete len:539 (+),score=99.87 TRINITY_DN25385_c0_g1_i1:131-1747(+)
MHHWMLFAVAVAAAATNAAGAAVEDQTFDIDLTTLTHLPLWEPTLEEYFPAQSTKDRDENGLASPVVLTSPTREEFVHHARRGYPILVSDWSKGMVYDGWSGEDFATKFPFGYMKAEYITDMKGFRQKDHDVKMIDGEMRFKLGTFKPDKKTMWYNLSRPASLRYKDDPQKPTNGPYVWHVKDELTSKQKKLVQAHFETPAFLQDPLNRHKMNESFELWFSPGSGTGAGAHNDGYCQSVVSLQLTGDKKWRKMLEPDMTFLHSFDEFDGGVYEAGYWKPDLGFVNYRGGAVIWPPGYLHETKTLPPPDGKCGAAITLQFSFPQPVQFIRAFLPRLSLSAEVGQCLHRDWSGYVIFFLNDLKPSHKQATMEEQLKKILAVVDSNGDERITVNETIAHFKEHRTTALRGGIRPQDKDLYIQFHAEDTVAYHDKDDDMVVSRQELWDSLVQWNVVSIRMKKGLKFMNTADRKGLEDFEKSLDRFRRKPMVLPKKLRPELQEIFQLPKATKIFPSMKSVKSLSDSEFFSPLRDRLDELRHEL